jgi:hypothetical protein
MPMATNENIVTERTIDGDKPAKMAKDQSERTMIPNFSKEPFLELQMGFNKKVININIKPTCKPETDST